VHLGSRHGNVQNERKKYLPIIKLCPSRDNSNIEITARLSCVCHEYHSKYECATRVGIWETISINNHNMLDKLLEFSYPIHMIESQVIATETCTLVTRVVVKESEL
jgi:hypothetical protein